MSILQHSDQSDESLPIKLYPPQTSLCEEFVPFQTAFFRTSDREQRIRLETGLETNDGPRVRVCLHPSRCDADQCEIDPSLREDTPITADTVHMSVHGKPVSELKEVGGCFFLANEDGLIWREEAGEELAGEFAIRTPNTLSVFRFLHCISFL
jgi:hypothetical protein